MFRILAQSVLLFWLLATSAAGFANTLQLSLSPDRSNPTPLDGATLSGAVYVFVAPSSSLDQVQFFIDGTRVKTENAAPWDLGGTAGDKSALPVDAESLGNGGHEMTASLRLADGSLTTLTASFSVGNAQPGLIAQPNALSMQSTNGSTASLAFTVSDSGGAATNVALAATPGWLTLSAASGTTPAGFTAYANPAGLSDGTYQGTITLSADGYPSATVNVTFQVGANPGEPAPQLHLTWDHAQSAITALWFTAADGSGSDLQYRLAGTTSWQSVTGTLRHSNDDGWYHQATINGVTPGSVYDYRVRLSPSSFSRVYQTRSQPAAGESWDLAFVADTGLLGRLDGLTNGTQAVIDAIRSLNPRMILLGGDYAYYDKDKRYGTLERTIDAWFNQMAPLAPYAPMMPVWGNHEILNNEGFEFWHARFPTPEHWQYDGGRMYAFDVGDVHFIAVYGLRESNDGIPLDGVAWLDNHLNEVKNAGYRWIIPYLHAAPFSDGSNHVSAETIRGHIAPLFEAAGVKLVLSAHDQSYERTYPLEDAAGAIRVTGTNLDCVDRQGGITWMKISPGGKMSDKNDGFSQWMTEPPPYWTARRDNTAHHFGHLRFPPNGDVQISVYQVTDGQVPRIFDQFTLTEDCDGGALSALPAQLSFQLEADATQTLDLQLTHDTAGTSLSLSTTADWLSVSAVAGASPLNVQVTADSAGRVAGRYEASVNVSGGGSGLSVPVTLTVSADGHQLVMTDSPQRTNPRALDGATVSSPLYVELLPTEGVSRVRFFVEEQQVKNEGVAPYDMGGTASNGEAQPFSLANYPQGPLAIRADVVLSDGSVTPVYADVVYGTAQPYLDAEPNTVSRAITLPETRATANVTLSASEPTQATLTSSVDWLSVAPNPATTPATLTLTMDATGLTPGSYSGQISAVSAVGSDAIAVSLTVLPEPSQNSPIRLSLSADRSAATDLAGATVSGNVYVFVEDSNADKVRFYLDGALAQTEYNAPWDLAGTSSNAGRPANPFDTGTLTTGTHTMAVEIITGTTTERYQASFTVTR